MNKLNEISFKDRKAIFDRLEQVASQANLTDEERARLDEDWKNYNDFFNTVDFARDEGRAEEKLEIAKKMKAKGQPLDLIVEITGLSIEEIEKL